MFNEDHRAMSAEENLILAYISRILEDLKIPKYAASTKRWILKKHHPDRPFSLVWCARMLHLDHTNFLEKIYEKAKSTHIQRAEEVQSMSDIQGPDRVLPEKQLRIRRRRRMRRV
jgi:hypothetical protein